MKYPSKIKKRSQKGIDFANRGMSLENDLNLTNEYYIEKNIAIIHKKPTPIKLVKITFDCQKNAKINEAYFQSPSTTDYNGIYQGAYLDFEAKETKTKNFPLANINQHQINHLRKIIEHKGIAFLIIRFSIINETYLIKGEDFIDFIDKKTRKSIPYSYFKDNCFLIKESYCPRLDYIIIIKDLYFGGNYEKNDEKN